MFIDYFKDDMNTPITVLRKGAVVGQSADGKIEYGPDQKVHEANGAFYLLSANEQFVNDRIANPSTHRIVLDPRKVTLPPISPTDTVVIKGEEYRIFPGEDVLDYNELLTYQVYRRR